MMQTVGTHGVVAGGIGASMMQTVGTHGAISFCIRLLIVHEECLASPIVVVEVDRRRTLAILVQLYSRDLAAFVEEVFHHFFCSICR